MSVCFIKGKQKFTVSDCISNLNILGHAQLIELNIGSECGGHGICGKDKVRIPEAQKVHFSPPTEKEKSHLSESEIADGWRLSCQIYPQNDGLTLEIYLSF